MPSCKFCGKKVEAARVFHRECREREAAEILGEFCGHYCKWPERCRDEDELDGHCGRCALAKVFKLGV